MEPAELVPPPAVARVYLHGVRAELGDVAPSGRARLDAVARWLQDAAFADWLDARVDGGGAWVVRRLRMRVARFPRFGDRLEVATFCSGTGALWAERRSTVSDGAGPLVEAVALWVHLDPRGDRPMPLPAGFDAVYGSAAAGRRVRARLRHPAEPPAGAPARPWRFRAADLDLAGHVNNAIYWQVLEEDLVPAEPDGGLEVEIEHRAAADAGEAVVRADGAMRWIAAPDGAVLATLAIGPQPHDGDPAKGARA
jgi:acyl-ACP thioesterase